MKLSFQKLFKKKPKRPEDLQNIINTDKFSSFDSIVKAVHKTGIQIENLIIGIDFTNSNEFSGTVKYNSSMHSGSSPYKKCLMQLKSCFNQLKVKKVFAYRFGCSETTDERVLPLSDEANVISIDEVIRAYDKAVKSVELSGPTSYQPMFQEAMKISNQQMTLLIILTDGDIQNKQRDMQALIELSKFPIACCAIGFGDGPFNTMEEFDDMIGRKFDNFQFAEYDDGMDVGLDVFQELSTQMEDAKLLGYL
ncbi:Copine_I [Hexamita inflata]|uniref:Copine I n=1 Tax=Hexamita inflata TaxID=28002 RepID=A0AA86PY93_9EUKA|nr:Copine I [Hexamita inflata]